MIPQKQLSLADIFEDCQNLFLEDKPAFLSLLESHIRLDEIVPASFYNHYYSWTGRHRTYPLTAMLWALIIQKLFSIPTDRLLLVFLQYSRHLRDFCGFTKVPDASKITRFKQDFLPDLQLVFDNLVDLTEPICQAIDSEKASMTIFDSSGIEAFVRENNPKFADSIIRQLKSYAKAMNCDKSFDPYKVAYSRMPSSAATNHDIKQLFINGHFCYVYKFGMITNGLGIVRDLPFFNKDFFLAHPEIKLEKKSDSPDEDKSVHDARLLIPVLLDFFKKHPLINPKTFLGDAAFDSSDIYKALLAKDAFGPNRCFSKVFIPLNARSTLSDPKPPCPINADGIPCCPEDSSLLMKYEGVSSLRNGTKRFKFICPKVTWGSDRPGEKYHRVCHCEHPCTDSPSGRMTYVYPEQNLRAYPGILRGSKEWEDTYKIRTEVERSIEYFKTNLCVADRRTQNEKTLHADLLLAGICQLLSVVVAHKIHRPEHLKSIKKFIA